MKSLILTLAGSMTLAGAAFADTATVEIPSNIKTPEGARAYTTALDKAVTKVCRNEFSPVIGINYYSFKTCLAQTRASVAKDEPTGLYASRFSKPATSLALASK